MPSLTLPRRAHSRPRLGFTLVELLVVIAIIAILISIILPSMMYARFVAKRTTCGSNMRQIATATAFYLNDYNETLFWRGTDINLEGMDWYVYGGRETGNLNTDQGGLFNNVVPRPINSYVGNALQVFRCPHDEGGFDWAAGGSHYEWVGNSYSFNSVGYPLTAVAPYTNKGLAGRRTVELKHPDRTVLYMDTSLHKAPGSWHGKYGNISFVDAHVEFIGLPPEDPTTSGIYWDP